MPIEEIQTILNKFKSEETKINTQLEDRTIKNEVLCDNKPGPSDVKNLDEVIKRNKQILKDLETIKANLRSKAIFSPAEMQWEQICKDYKDNPSLPVTTYRCHLPVFV